MPGFSKPRVQVDSSRFFARIVGEEGRVLEEAVALLVAVAGQFVFQESVEAAGPRSGRVWAETRVEDFRDGMVDPMMFVSRRAQLDPDSGCVEFFSRFDVDNNGYFDLVCADDSGPYLRLYFGSSSGYSPERRRLFPVPGGGNIDLADLDLDGRAELVHSGWRSGHVTIYWGSDSGPSPSDTTWLVVSGQSEAVAVYDLDRDSYLDVLAGSDNGMLYIFWGSASGYSSANRSSVFLGGAIGHNLEVADLDRDGFGDVVASMWSRSQAAVLYWGAGRTPKSVVWLPVSPNNPHGVSVADLNGDCWLDVVLTGYDTVWTAFLYYGSESGFSTQNRELIHPGRCYGGSAVVAWDADKSLDLVFFRGDWGRTNTYRPRVFYNRLDTTPHFSDAWSSEIGELAFNASGGFVADLNYDGYLDLFVNNMLPDSASYVLWGPYYVNSTALPADRDHHGVWREPGNIYNRAFNASYLSSVFDIGPDTVIAEGSCSWVANEPPGSSVGIEVRAGDSPVPDSAWTDFFPVAMNGGSLPTPVMGRRFLQYRANFNYTRPCHLPQLERIAFELNPAPAVDVGVPRILAPTGDVDSGRVVVPRVEIRNYRTSAPVARVTLKIGSGWSWTMTDSLAPLQTDTLFFPDWLATIPGVHAVRCSVYAELDENPANDTLSTTVRVVVGSDVGPVEIVSPPVAAESGTVHVPRVVVRDFGTRAETFPVHLWIGSSYHQVVSDTLGPGASDTVAFPPWLATPAGPQLVRCSTALSRDEHPENDTLSRITYVWTKIDAAAVGIVAPTDTVDSGTVVVPLALVTNLGTSPASIPIRMRIGSGYSADGMAAVSPGETVLVAFRDWVASPVGTHAVRCSTMLAGDTINGNDLRTDSVTVVAHRDAYSVAILAPTGAIDSGTVVTPICRIGNNGTGPELIPARLRIGTDYLQTRSKLINPGETDTIHFPNWVAQPVGLIAVQCSTALAGDEQPENDTVSTYVQVGSRIDAAALAVLAPVGLVDSGAVIVPVCSIANLSTGSQLIPVRLTIGAGYSESRTKFLLPAESDTVGFPVWTASPSGTFIVTCSTALAGDTFRQNDTVRATVQVVPRIDAALTAIIAPSGAVDSGALVIPAVAVTNLGSGTEDIPVQIVIGTGYSGENSIILASGETDTLFFAEWVAQPVGTHSVIANTYLTGDRDPSNDTARGSVMVGRRVDAGVTAILAPVGEIDSGDVVTPVCRIENNGTSAAMVPVTMRITNGYQESRTKLVPAGAQDTVRFPDWLASPVGGFAVFCSTCLAGDTFCGNDTLSDSVHVLACIDAAALNIVTPTGVLDSGTVVTPVATIANLGSELAVIPTWFWIGSDYAAMRSKMLAPGSSDTVQFPVWTAEPLGQLPVRCSTALVQDRHPENDTTRDSIEVRLGVDAAALAIIRPTGTVDSGITVVPLVRVGNNSSRSQTVPVRLQIGSGYTEFANIRLGPGTWDTVRFPVWCAEVPGLLSVRCSTALAGDQHPENDTISDSVRVVARVDAGVTMIVAPAGTVDSGQVVVPCARVVNSSVSPKLVPVQLTIGSFYSANRDKLLMSGQEDTVQFVPWEASQLGIHPVRCSTMLTGDENPINDTLSGEVLVRVRIDAAAVNIVAPVGVIDSGTTVVPRAVVANLGAHTEVVPVHFLIGNDYHESTAVTIEPESSQVVLFPEWTASTVGRFRVACSTGLAGDVNLENDTVVTSVVVVERHDMSCYRVVAPTGTVDSGTVVVPRAMVTNLGLGPEDAPVWCFIGAEYGDMRIVTVNPGESVMVAFREWIASPVGLLPVRCSTALAGDTTNGNDLALDSVLVVTHPDAGVTDIYAPIGVVDSGSVVQPCVRVGNYGTSPVLVPVRMKIGEGYEELRSKFLGAGAKDTVLFPGWVAQPLGSHVVSCSTELAGDEWPENDRKCDSVRIVSFCDAALLAIIAPQGRVDSGSMIVPMAVVANWGISAALVPVRMRIASDYDSTVGVLIPAGAIDTIRFPNWLATQVGVQAMRCSTELPGDYNNGNDFLNATVEVTVYRDAACLEIQVPKQSIDSGVVVTPRALIQNRSTSLAEIPLFMRIGQDYLRSRRKFLASGQADTVFFPAWQAHPGGIVAVTCSVALAGDQFVKNNAIHESVYVVHYLDAGVTAILAPFGRVDSGHKVIPKARVVNLGMGQLAIPVEMRIGDCYRSVKSKLIPAGGSDTVHFDAWSAVQVGHHPVRCTTMLPNDNNPANDFLDAEVAVVWRDAGCPRVLAPAGTVPADDTVLPRAVVRNFGTETDRIPAVFRYGQFYAQLVYSDSLAPGDSAVLVFPPLVIVPGEEIASCSTALHGDMFPPNNRYAVTVLGATSQIRLEPDSSTVAPPAGIVNYYLTCYNHGNCADTIDITQLRTRPNWQIQFFDSSGTNELIDHNGNGVVDLGPVPAQGRVVFVSRITVPADELGLVTDSTQVQATSGRDESVWDRANCYTTVKAIADLLIEPDQLQTTAPGKPVDQRFVITNLGNIEDYADLSWWTTNSRWQHELLDGTGKGLGDRNNNGRKDIGPIAPHSGIVVLVLRVTPDGWSQLGQRDTSYITVQSFADGQVTDEATAITEVAGAVTGLLVEPDQTGVVPVGDSAIFGLWVETSGTIQDVVNLTVTCSGAGWQTVLLDETGEKLRDTDFDNRPDLGLVWPGTRRCFVLKVRAPSSAQLVGYIESLSAKVTVTGSAASDPGLSDSSNLVLVAVPRFEIHSHYNSLSDRIRFIFSTPSRGRVSLLVYNRLGELLRRLIDGDEYQPGIYSLEWDGTDEEGQRLAPGIYLYLFEVRPERGGSHREVKKVIIKR